MTLWLASLAQKAQQNRDKDLSKWAKEVTQGHARALAEFGDHLDGTTRHHGEVFARAQTEALANGDTLLAESMQVFAAAAAAKNVLFERLEAYPHMSDAARAALEDELSQTYRTALAEADRWNALNREAFELTQKQVVPALGEDRFRTVATPMRQDLSSGKYFDQTYRHAFARHVADLCKGAVTMVDRVHDDGGCSGKTYQTARAAVAPGGPLEASLHYYARQFSVRQVGLIARDIRQLLTQSRDHGLLDEVTAPPPPQAAAARG
jgi:hypothetical protein